MKLSCLVLTESALLCVVYVNDKDIEISNTNDELALESFLKTSHD